MTEPRRAARTELSAREELLATVGPSPRSLLDAGLPFDAFERWDRRHGAAYRAAHNIASEADLAKLAARPYRGAGDPPPPPP
jgi:hypothetical protein